MKILKNNEKTLKRINSGRWVYLVGRWAHYGVWTYRFAGKFVWCEEYQEYLPLVYSYYDGNGTCDEWHIVPIYDVTTGSCYAWSFNEEHAKLLADKLERCDETYSRDRYEFVRENSKYSTKESSVIFDTETGQFIEVDNEETMDC